MVVTSNNRTADHQIPTLFLDRWSPRGFDQSIMPNADLLSMFEAARWAPSGSNIQPWNFVYAKRESADWPEFIACLMDGNQVWAKNASVIMFAISRNYRVTSKGDKTPNGSHAFDTGAAWMALALQAKNLGYFAHGMGGIHKDIIAEKFGLSDDYVVQAAIAVGRLASRENLSPELAAREVPSQRKPISEFVFEGKFTPQD